MFGFHLALTATGRVSRHRWLVDWLIDCSVDRLIGWSIVRLIDWLAFLQAGCEVVLHAASGADDCVHVSPASDFLLFVHTITGWPQFYPFIIQNRVITFVAIIVLACCENVRRQAPWNFVILGVFVSFAPFFSPQQYSVVNYLTQQRFCSSFFQTLCESWMLGSIAR